MWESSVIPLATRAEFADMESTTTTLTADSTSHVKGAWVELDASTAFDVTWVGLSTLATAAGSTDTGQLMDLGVGTSGNEKVVIPNILTGYSVLLEMFAWFPVNIPAGTRLSGRIQASVSSDTVDVGIYLLGGGRWGGATYDAIDDIGAKTSGASNGTQLESDGIVELVASSAHDYKALGVMFDLGVGGDFGGDNRLVEIFVGAGAAEKSVISNLWFRSGGSENVSRATYRGFIPMAVDIPAGTRISAQGIGNRDCGIVVYGFR